MNDVIDSSGTQFDQNAFIPPFSAFDDVIRAFRACIDPKLVGWHAAFVQRSIRSSMSVTVHELQLDQQPQPVLACAHEFRDAGENLRLCPHTNFLKGVQWSPDGACLLTTSEDNLLRVYDLPAEVVVEPAKPGDAAACPVDTLQSVLQVDEGETVYDYAWYPGMLVSEPASCVFACTARGHPIHLWDALSGELRASYRVYNAADEVTAACSIAFDEQGHRLFAGLNNRLCIFDVARPGRYYKNIVPHSRASPGLQGIISCMACNPDRSAMLAAGSYLGDTGIFEERSGDLLYVLQGQRGGITQVQFSRDGNYLYTGARRDTDIFCWDIRYTSDVIYRLHRDSADTNQRIQFDIEPLGRHLATGGSKGRVQVFDLQDGQEVGSYPAAADTVNGFQFHPFLPLAATASGHRRLPASLASDSDSEEDSDSSSREASQRPQTRRSIRTAATPAQDCLENALVVWQFQSTLRELMDVEAAELDAGHAQEPNEQEHNVQANGAGANGSVSIPHESEARRAADDVLGAVSHDHDGEQQEGVAVPIDQNQFEHETR